MKVEQREWLSRNIEKINEVFLLPVGVLPNSVDIFEIFIDIYDTEEIFNKEVGIFEEEKSAFEYLKNEGYAALIDGKFVFFDYLALVDLMDSYPR